MKNNDVDDEKNSRKIFHRLSTLSGSCKADQKREGKIINKETKESQWYRRWRNTGSKKGIRNERRWNLWKNTEGKKKQRESKWMKSKTKIKK